MMTLMTPAERLALIAKVRDEYAEKHGDAERVRARLMLQIRKALAEADDLPDGQKRQLGPSAISRAAGFTREYISQIRADKTK